MKFSKFRSRFLSFYNTCSSSDERGYSLPASSNWPIANSRVVYSRCFIFSYEKKRKQKKEKKDLKGSRECSNYVKSRSFFFFFALYNNFRILCECRKGYCRSINAEIKVKWHLRKIIQQMKFQFIFSFYCRN